MNVWSVITMSACNGWTISLDEALERVRELEFDQWRHEPHG